MQHGRIINLEANLLHWVSLALISAVAVLFLPANQDSVWQVWIGRQVMEGASLYTDILEVNPPLLFWIGIGQAAIAELVGSRVAILISAIALTALSLWLTPVRFRLPALAAASILPMGVVGKAEHFTLIATIPYVFLIATRLEGGEVQRPWAIGFLAAIGFAMKPYFILVPLALEGLAWREKRVRPETSALAIAAAAYAAAVLIFVPAYLTDVVPMLRAAYDEFGVNKPSPLLLLAFTFAATGFIRRTPSLTAVTLGVAAVCYLPAVYIQAKGWSYQSIPARGFLLLAIVAWMMSTKRRIFQDGLLVGAALLCVYPSSPYRNSYLSETNLHLKNAVSGSTVAVISADPAIAWPTIEERGLKWALSTMCMWQVSASLHNQAVKADMEARLASDLSSKPDVVIVDQRSAGDTPIKSFLPKDFLRDYTPQLQTARMESFVRVRPPLQLASLAKSSESASTDQLSRRRDFDFST